MNSRTPSPLYLSAADLRRVLPMRDAIEAMRLAFIELSSGQVTLPIRQSLATSDEQGINLVMPCYSPALQLFSLKTVTVYDNNWERQLPTIQAMFVLTDAATGVHLAMMDGASLTAIRTGAVSGAATDLLARPDATIATVFGAGVQARTQLEAVCCVRDIRQARVFDTNREAAERFAAEMTSQLDLPVQPADTPRDALHNADIVCTATPSPTPVFEDSDLAPETHINAVGAFRPETAEVPAEVVCRARVVVDHRESALEEAGDLIGPLQQGRIEPSHIHAELGELLSAVASAPAAAKKAPSGVTLFKSVGVAIQDLYAGAKAVENARRLELGTVLT